jgi:hypothetical protein
MQFREGAVTKEPTSKMISIRFDAELMEKIKVIAEREDRTFAAQLQRMLREWLVEHPDESMEKPAKGRKS